MKIVVINPYEKIVSDDIIQMQLAMNQSLQDDFLYRFFGQTNTGVIGADLTVSYVSALSASVAVGVGFIFDAGQTGNTPKYRMVKASSPIHVVLAAADPSNPRIDRVSLSPNLAVTGTASRFVKAGGTGPIALQTVNKTQEMTYTLVVTQGTPGGVPVAPSTPAGCLSLATLLVSASTGMSGAGAVTDTRTVFSFAVSNSGHNILVGTSIQTQTDNADQALSKILPVTTGMSGVTIATTLSQALHAGRVLQVDTTLSVGTPALTLPALSSNSGFKCEIDDVVGNFDVTGLTLIPNGTDKINGLNVNYKLDDPWRKYMLQGDSTYGWLIK